MVFGRHSPKCLQGRFTDERRRREVLLGYLQDIRLYISTRSDFPRPFPEGLSNLCASEKQG